MNTLVPSFFYLIFFVSAGNKDMHKSLDEFEFQPDPTTDSVNCPLAFEKNPCIMFGNSSTFIFDLIFFILARNKAMHNSLLLFFSSKLWY